ncbi:MAG: GMC family oxidoreductase N-terminal domain-containing protein [Pseudomonadales bacterium]
MDPYDYVIVGAGSAGCVLANRLSADPDKRTLLIEAGGNDNNLMLHIPAGWATNFRNPKVDWGYNTQPEPGLNNRSIYWPRGKVLGGSSSINGMVYVRGVALDFERWAQSGATGWGYDEVLPYFRKAEAQQRVDDEFHGLDGPLYVEDVRDKRAPMDAFVEGMVEIGIPRNDDFNGADQAGGGYYQFNQHAGRRWSTATAYLDPVKRRSNLDLITGALVRRVLFDGKVVSGLEVARNGGVLENVRARQVILCGGAINSPQLLELSGIGGGELLQRLGINVVHDLPEVGENLQDHVMTKAVYGTHPDQSINREVQGWRLLPTAMKWLFLRRGPLTTGSAPVGGFWYSRDGLEAPDLQIHFASGATLYNSEGRIRPMPIPAMTAVVNQSRPESVGSIHIDGIEPGQPPLIQANYLDSEVDRQTLIRGLRMIVGIFETEAMGAMVTGRLAPDVDMSSDDELLEYIRNDASTTFHPTSTCRIGSVVDANLRVQGVAGLSVADASVMPYVVSGNTNAATIMIAEKAADLFLAAEGS